MVSGWLLALLSWFLVVWGLRGFDVIFDDWFGLLVCWFCDLVGFGLCIAGCVYFALGWWLVFDLGGISGWLFNSVALIWYVAVKWLSFVLRVCLLWTIAVWLLDCVVGYLLCLCSCGLIVLVRNLNDFVFGS